MYFVDKNKELINNLKSRRSYITAFSENKKYKLITVKYEDAFILGEEDNILDEIDFVFSCVGPINVGEIAKKLKKIPLIISFENDYSTVLKIKEISQNPNCFFGIPDVISSNTCCSELKKVDSLCLISELGELVLEKGNYEFPNETKIVENIDKYWNCKFFLHNTPYAAAAFLGKIYKLEYLHEAMKIDQIEQEVLSLMNSIKKAMIIRGLVEKEFIEFYSEKELI